VSGHLRRSGSPSGSGSILLAAIGWLLVAAVVVLPFVHTFTRLSFIDEYQHVDYLAKTQQLEHVNGGERVGQVAMREQACRGMDLEGVVLPKCGKRHYDPVEFPGAGFNHTYADPPTYYLITAPLTSAVQKVTGLDSMVTAARSIGVLWLGAGLTATWALALRLGASRRAAVGATLLIATTPAVMLSGGTVTTDAPQLLAGGILCLVALAVVEGRRAWWWLAPTAFAVSAFKVTSLAAVGLVAVLLVATWWARRRGPTADDDATTAEDVTGPGATTTVTDATTATHEWRALAAMLVGAVIPLVAWNAYSSATAFSSVDDIPVGQQFKVTHLTWASLTDSVPRMVSPVRRPSAPVFVMSDTVTVLLALTNVLLVIACVAVAWYGSQRQVVTRLALGTAVAMALGAPAYLVMLYVTEHVSYWIPGRYGLSILPAAAALLAVAASRRNVGGSALLVLGGLSAVALLAQTI
jgi:hypothetical protein